METIPTGAGRGVKKVLVTSRATVAAALSAADKPAGKTISRRLLRVYSPRREKVITAINQADVSEQEKNKVKSFLRKLQGEKQRLAC
jgi:hypothetical protein